MQNDVTSFYNKRIALLHSVVLTAAAKIISKLVLFNYFYINRYQDKYRVKLVNSLLTYMKFMWIVFALSAAFTSAVVVILSKAGIKNLDSSLAFAMQAVLILIVTWSVVFFQGKQAEILNLDTRTWVYLAIAGVLTAVSSLLSFRALKLGDAAAVSPIERLSLVFAIIFAAIFLKERVTWQVMAGAALMAAGAIIIAVAKKTT